MLVKSNYTHVHLSSSSALEGSLLDLSKLFTSLCLSCLTCNMGMKALMCLTWVLGVNNKIHVNSLSRSPASEHLSSVKCYSCNTFPREATHLPQPHTALWKEMLSQFYFHFTYFGRNCFVLFLVRGRGGSNLSPYACVAGTRMTELDLRPWQEFFEGWPQSSHFFLPST